MNRDSFIDPAKTACELVRLLHQGAGADEFARFLAEIEAWPAVTPDKAALVETVRMAMAVRNRLDVQQQRERGLMAVIESAEDLSSRLELDGLLAAIVARARELLGSDVGWLSVLDADRSEFRVVTADGALRQATTKMMVHHDRGVASVVMSTRLPFTTADYVQDRRFSHDPVLDETFREEGLVALAGVPLIWDGEVIGLLFVADRYPRTHSAQSISILCTLATHGAVAIRNARDFERANAALDKANRAHAELERYARGIQAAADAHERMTSLIARGASLSVLCETVAQLVDGSVLVLDEAAHVISRGSAQGYEGAQAARYEPHGERSAELAHAFQSSRRLGRSVAAYEADGETCRVMAVIGGDDVLGSIVLFHRGELEEVMVRTFERSSSVIGIVLLSQERMEAARNRGASTLLRSLISPRPEEAAVLANRAERQGFDLHQPLALMLVHFEGASAMYAARSLRTTDPVAGALVDDAESQLVVLCAATRAQDVRQAVCRWARQHVATGYRGVLSRPLHGPAEIPAAYSTLTRALPVLARIGVQHDIVSQNELALYSTLFETHDQASLTSFLDATIGPLIAHDRKRNSELASTLLTYFDCNQNAKTTADRLGIHVNTVRQRLATTEELLGHWGNATRALEIHIALRLWDLSGSRTRGGPPSP
ncbi:MAG TPA: helix-turn-helix domain-containing protein [Ramlibacter sp.]|nr:helix-turn-helix domain-containing protein [Ramlibacter sp.]